MMGESGVRNTAIALSLALHGALFWTYGERIWQPAERPAASHPIVAQLSIAEPQAAEPSPREPIPSSKPAPPKPKVVQQPKPKLLRPSPVVQPEPVMTAEQAPVQPAAQELEPVEAESAEAPLVEEPSAAVAVAGTEPVPSSASEEDEEKAAEELRRYLAALQVAIARHKAYPSMARRRGIEGQVEVSFMLLADGNARDIQVSGGPKPLRSAARQAVHKALRFPPPPAGTPTPLPVQYAMNFSLR